MTPLLIFCLATSAWALRTTPTGISATQQSDMTAAVSTWQTNIPLNLSGLVDSSAVDAVIYPLTILSTTLISPLTSALVSSAETNLSITIAPDATIVNTVNDTTDITQALIGPVNFTFTSDTPTQFTFIADSLGADYASYTANGSNYTLLVQ